MVYSGVLYIQEDLIWCILAYCIFRRIIHRNGDLVRSKNRILVSVIVQKLTLPSVIVPSSSVARFCSTVCYCTSK